MTAFTITTEVMDSTGKMGVASKTISATKPFFIDFELPPYAIVDDEMKIKVMVKNNRPTLTSVTLNINFDQDVISIVETLTFSLTAH